MLLAFSDGCFEESLPSDYPGLVDFEATINKAGRIQLPKVLCDKLHLRPGDRLSLTVEGGEIRLRPAPHTSLVREKRGVWVFCGEPTDTSVFDPVDRQREQRIRAVTQCSLGSKDLS